MVCVCNGVYVCVRLCVCAISSCSSLCVRFWAIILTHNNSYNNFTSISNTEKSFFGDENATTRRSRTPFQNDVEEAEICRLLNYPDA